MIGYIARKLLLAVPLVFAVVSLLFVLLELSPGDGATKWLDPSWPPELHDQMVKGYGLDQPASVRYLKMLWSTLQLDFGVSFTYQRPVFEVLGEALPNTLLLSGMTLLVLFPAGLALGILQATRPGTAVDTSASIVSLTLYSMPAFWLALLLQVGFGLYWSEWIRDLATQGWLTRQAAEYLSFPPMGMKDAVQYDWMSPTEQWIDRARHLLLPAVAMGVASAASVARYMRSSMLDVLGQDFVRTARAKGLTERQVTLRHGARNALLPMVTLLGLSLPYLFSGSILVEIVFAWPGTGRLIYEAILGQDTPLLIGCFYAYTLVVVAGNLVSDILYAWVDPRIRLT